MTQAARPVLRRWTRHEYERLIDHGFLDEDDPIELLDGLLLVKEPQHSAHRTAVLLVAKALERAFGEGWFVQTQSPIVLGDRSEPEPDVCVVRGSPRDYVDAHPTRPARARTGRRERWDFVSGRTNPRRTPAPPPSPREARPSCARCAVAPSRATSRRGARSGRPRRGSRGRSTARTRGESTDAGRVAPLASWRSGKET